MFCDVDGIWRFCPGDVVSVAPACRFARVVRDCGFAHYVMVAFDDDASWIVQPICVWHVFPVDLSPEALIV